MAKTLSRALAGGQSPQEKIVQPAIVITQEQPPRFPEELAMSEPPIASSFTGDDAIRYLAKLSLIQQVKKREKEREELRQNEDTSESESQSQEAGDDVVGSDTMRDVGVETASEDANAEFAEPEVEPPVDSNMAVGDGMSGETVDAPVHDSSVAESDSDVSETESVLLSDSDTAGTETVHVAETPSSENNVSDGNDSNVAESGTTSDLFQALADELLDQQEEKVIEGDPENSGADENESKSQSESENQRDLANFSESEREGMEWNGDSSQLDSNPVERNADRSRSELNSDERSVNISESVERNGDIAQSDSSPAEQNEGSRQINSNPEEHNSVERGNEIQLENDKGTKEPVSDEDSGAVFESTEPPASSQRTDTTSPRAKNKRRTGARDKSDPKSAVKAPIDNPLSREGLVEYISSAADLISRNITPVQRRVPGKIKTREDVRNEEIKKRFPGHRPWPTLDECLKRKVPKTIPFTSTWLAVTAKKIE